MPQISVIVPVYKVEPYLHRCVDSILAQTFTDFELVLVDDGSPDNCGAICDEYAMQDPRIHVIHQKNGGLSAARNAGIDWMFANSDSEWISFIDSDDWIHPEYFEVLYKVAKTAKSDITICEYSRVEKHDNKFMPIDPNKFGIYNTEEYYVSNRVNATIACAKLYNISAFSSHRFPIGKIHEDEFTTYKVLFQFENIAVIHQQLYFYFNNENSITGQKWHPKRMDALEAFEQQIQFFTENAFILARENTIQIYIKDYAYAVKKLKERSIPGYVNCQKKLRHSIRKYIRDLHLSEKEKERIYEAAYPNYLIVRKYIHKKWIHFLEIVGA